MDIIEGPYLADLLEQPAALERTLGALQRLPANDWPGPVRPGTAVLLTGMGSSFHALYPLELALVAAGIAAVRVETAELIQYQPARLAAATVVIAVSQSGRSAETVLMLDQLVSEQTLIGVTNDADSPLARRSDRLVLLQAGPEASVSCKSYVATLIALELLANVLTGRTIDWAMLASAPDRVAAYLHDWRDHATAVAPFAASPRLFLAGRGRSLASVGTGALIFKEATRAPAEGMSAAAFRHGPIELVDANTVLILFAGEPQTLDLNLRLADTVRAAGGRAIMVGTGATIATFGTGDAPDRLSQVLEILPIQMMTLARAAQQGVEAGCFTLASKITITA